MPDARPGHNSKPDKAFSKKMMRDASIPQAEGRAFTSLKAAMAFVETRNEPLVVKAAGLAKGKGVIICSDPVEALDAVRNIMEKKIFGDAGNTVVIEERTRRPRRFRCSPSSMEPTPICWKVPRITSASAKMTPAQTPAEWAPIRRRRS